VQFLDIDLRPRYAIDRPPSRCAQVNGPPIDPGLSIVARAARPPLGQQILQPLLDDARELRVDPIPSSHGRTLRRSRQACRRRRRAVDSTRAR
jgi:hypothetical protein